MASDKFILIDKSIVFAENTAEFSIYFPVSLGSDMECFIKRGDSLTLQSRAVLREKKALYIVDTEKDIYKAFYDEYMLSAKKREHDENSALVYAKATDLINELYHNPETLGAQEKSKEVVNDLVQTILHDEFTVRSMMSIATHDYYTHTHSLNVSIYALSLGSFLNLNENQLSELGEVGLLHDLGKSKISPDIINKNGKLTDQEFNKMKKHPELGFYLSVQMGIKNKNILNGIKHHHEKMDGSGYPSGLRGNSIPMYARIVGICDVFDALTSKRSYKEAMPTFDALKLIKTNMNNHIDMKLLNEMIKMFK